ncbi:MAG TPA: asparagine synthase (glutamine-hydrolyzing) [Peptococcaceae bacterium]|nr:asparagine synthase (glutamine-hydrolyzing) [Peptococcaceae bacterium]
MCGIAGFCSFAGSFLQDIGFWQEILVAMRTAVAHRGRDSSGEYLCEHTGMSHARLAIRDLALGIQPLVSKVGGQEYAIVYNGEIYNVEEIKPQLENAGYQFQTTTDTEVILCAYIEYGADFVNRLNGIYAFAIWDGNKKQLLLYRDRLGVKPLFYTVKNDMLIFGSEIKALFCHPFVCPEIDIDSFREIFGLGPARTPGNGVFKGIYEVMPGHYQVFSRGGLRNIRYWQLEAREHTDDYEQTVETVSFLVQDAITRQLVSDVPVCSFLSGGIDSSIVTAVAANCLGSNGVRLNTFSFDFKGNESYFSANAFQPERDRPFVELMLGNYDLRHTYLECNETDLVDLLYTAVDAKDLPGMADVDASLLFFCSLVAKCNKVALTGECADEIFGGYPWFYKDELLNVKGFPWSKDLSMRMAFLAPDFVKELQLQEYVSDKYWDTLKSVPTLANETPAAIKHREITYLNIVWFMQTLLDRMDRMSMYSGLEARVPFADHRIVEYVYNVPWNMKYRNNMAKSLLREAGKNYLPEGILQRKKSPYPKTYHPNYERLLSQRLQDIVYDPNSPIIPLIDKKKLLSFLKAPIEYGKPWFGQLMAAPQLLAYFIQINYWLEKYTHYFVDKEQVFL